MAYLRKFVNVNNNPKNKKSCDCVIRALITTLNLDTETIIKDLTQIYLTKGWFLTDKKCYSKYLETKGYIMNKQPKKFDNTKYTAEEFCEYLNKNKYIKGTVMAHVGGHHVSTFVNTGTEKNRDYRIYDIWDCSLKCVGNYWIKSIPFTVKEV